MSDIKQYSLKEFLTVCFFAAQRARSITRDSDSYELLQFTDKLLYGEGEDCLMMGGLQRALHLFDLPEPPQVNMFLSVFTMLQHSELTKLSYFMRRSFVGSAPKYAMAPVDVPTVVELLQMDWSDTKRPDLSRFNESDAHQDLSGNRASL